MENEIKIIQNYLQQIDCKSWLFFILASTAYCKLCYILTENYVLQKDYSKNKKVAINLPPEIKETSFVVESMESLEERVQEIILDFVNTISQNLPHFDLSYLFKNLQSTVFKEKRTLISARGSYIVRKNTVKFTTNFLYNILYHELMHTATSVFDAQRNISFVGFAQYYIKSKTSIGILLNEGYTQLLVERYFEDKIKKEKEQVKIIKLGKTIQLEIKRPKVEIYSTQIQLAKCVEKIVGKEKMETLFSKANLFGLIEELTKYEDEENVIRFLTSLDFLHKSKKTKILLPKTRQILIEESIFINRFLLTCFMKKQKIEYLSNSLNKETLLKELNDYINSLIPKGKNNAFLTEDMINEIIKEVYPDEEIKNNLLRQRVNQA